MRGKRYALKVEDGKVSKAYVEPDNTGSAGEWLSSVAVLLRMLIYIDQCPWPTRFSIKCYDYYPEAHRLIYVL